LPFSPLFQPRDQGKVKHRTLANLTDWPKHILAELHLLLKGHPPAATLFVARGRPRPHDALDRFCFLQSQGSIS
jgi:hypothetical protein